MILSLKNKDDKIDMNGFELSSGNDPYKTWVSLVQDTKTTQLILDHYGVVFKRCLAVLNRLTAQLNESHELWYLMMSPPPSELEHNPCSMWFKEVHRRLISGVYYNECDFLYDMRLVLQPVVFLSIFRYI